MRSLGIPLLLLSSACSFFLDESSTAAPPDASIVDAPRPTITFDVITLAAPNVDPAIPATLMQALSFAPVPPGHSLFVLTATRGSNNLPTFIPSAANIASSTGTRRAAIFEVPDPLDLDNLQINFAPNTSAAIVALITAGPGDLLVRDTAQTIMALDCRGVESEIVVGQGNGAKLGLVMAGTGIGSSLTSDQRLFLQTSSRGGGLTALGIDTVFDQPLSYTCSGGQLLHDYVAIEVGISD